MTTSSIRDTIEWIEKINNKGIIEFRFRDLPNDLKNKKMFQKGIRNGLLESAKKENALKIWKISSIGKRKLSTKIKSS